MKIPCSTRWTDAVLVIILAAAMSTAFAEEFGSIDQVHAECLALAARRHPSPVDQDRLQTRVDWLSEEFPEDSITLYWQSFLMDKFRREDPALLLEKSLKSSSRAETASARQARGRALVLLASIRLADLQPAMAEQLALEALEIHPESVDACRLLVDACFATGRLDACTQSLATHARRPSATAGIWEIYTLLLLQQGRHVELEATLDERERVDTCCPVCLFHRGIEAEAAGDRKRGDELLAWASLNGSSDLETTARAQEILSRRAIDHLQRPGQPETIVAYVHDLILRMEIGLRRGLPIDDDHLREALKLSRDGKADVNSPARCYFALTAELLAGRADEEDWKAFGKRWPTSVAARARIAEILLASNDPARRREGEQTLAAALSLRSNHPLVRDLIRLGVAVQPSEDGVVIHRLESMSPLADAGLSAGDVVTQVGAAKLNERPAFERLRAVRLFTGGPIEWRTPDGAERREDVPVLLLD
jgi:hypothetical protein